MWEEHSTRHQKLQGRVGAIRLRNWQEDITAMVMHWLPKPSDGVSRAANKDTVQSRGVAQKDASGHARTKHAVHYVGPQRSDGHS